MSKEVSTALPTALPLKLKPGEHLVGGRVLYSAAWLSPAPVVVKERAR